MDREAGFWYSIYKTRPDYLYRYAHKWPCKGLKYEDREFEDDRFPDLKDKNPFLSPNLYPVATDLPAKVCMSVDDIKYVRREV